MGIDVTGVSQVVIQVADIPRALAFYRDVLGLPVWLNVPEQRMAFVRAGDVRLYLQQTDTGGSGVPVYLTTPSARRAVERLRASGVEIVGEPHVVHVADGTEHWLAFIADGEGNTLGLMSEEAACAAEGTS